MTDRSCGDFSNFALGCLIVSMFYSILATATEVVIFAAGAAMMILAARVVL